MRAFIAGRVFGSSAFGAVSRRSALLVLSIVPALVPPSSAQATQKNVLILSGGPGRVSINQMESSLRAHFSEPVNFSVVDLDNPRFEQKGYQDNLAEALRAGYASENLDLIVAVMIRALQFAVQYHDNVFPGVPIVFISVVNSLPDKTALGGITGDRGPRLMQLALRVGF